MQTEAVIKKAYRRTALKHHPDKNPGNAKAAEEFHRLSTAYDVLTDATARAAHDQARSARIARRKRDAAYDVGRRQMKEDLEARERASKRQRTDASEAERVFARELERAKQDASRRKAERDAELKRGMEERAEEDMVQQGDDRTVKVRLRKKKEEAWSEDGISKAMGQYGEVDSVVVGKKSALVVYKTSAGAHKAVGDDTYQVTFLHKPQQPTFTPQFEDITLMRMRMAERKRMEQEIRAREAQD